MILSKDDLKNMENKHEHIMFYNICNNIGYENKNLHWNWILKIFTEKGEIINNFTKFIFNEVFMKKAVEYANSIRPELEISKNANKYLVCECENQDIYWQIITSLYLKEWELVHSLNEVLSN